MSMAGLASCLGSNGPTFRCCSLLLIVWFLVDIGIDSGTTKTAYRSPLLLLLHGVSAFPVWSFSGMYRDQSRHAPYRHHYPKTTRLPVLLPPLPLKALVMSMDDTDDDSGQQTVVNGGDAINVTAMSSGRLFGTSSVVVHCQLSPRQWLESQDVDGAYTVIRCEYGSNNRTTTSSSSNSSNSISNITNGRQWTMAGIDFHLQRLHQSYQQLLLQERQHQSTPILVTEPKEASVELSQPLLSTNDDMLDTTRRQTEIVVERLLDALFEMKQQPESNVTGSPVAMVTILWQPPTRAIHETFSTNVNRNAMIRVRGHASFVPSSSTTLEHVLPITAAVSMPMKTCREWQPQHEPQYQPHCDDDDMGDHALRVNRQPFPQAKLSAWCRQRRPLEESFLGRQRLLLSHVAANSNADEFTAAASWHDDVDIHEVILTNHTGTACSNSHHDHHVDVLLLEGLTSNLFVVYPNNVIRTAGSRVLAGYARHLVTQIVRDGALLHESSTCCSRSSSSSSWTLDTTTPIRLEDAKQWQEVFVTSAIRLIVPVGRVVVPCGTTVDEHGSVRRVFQTAWSADDNQREENHYTPIWKTLYDLIRTRK